MGEPTQVFICHSGCVHEGGSTKVIAANREVAMEWLEAMRVEKLADAEGMNEFSKGQAEERGRDKWTHWVVDEIEHDGDRASFLYMHDIFLIRPIEVASRWPPEKRSSVPQRIETNE